LAVKIYFGQLCSIFVAKKITGNLLDFIENFTKIYRCLKFFVDPQLCIAFVALS